MAFITDSDRAQAAFNVALEQAKNTTRNLFNSYGFTKQGANGAWTTSAAGEAFNPSQFVTFDGGKVNINTEAIQRMASGDFGTAFGINKMTDVIGSASAREALAKQMLRGRGITRGGLTEQAGTAAESQQRRDLATLGSEFITGLSDVYGGVGTAVGDVLTSGIESSGTGAMTIADATPVSSSPPPATGAEPKPAGRGTKMYDLSPRREWRWMGNAQGWKKVK